MLSNAERLELWHRAVAEKNVEIARPLFAEDARLHTPVYLKPRQGRDVVLFLLSQVIEIFEDFTYHREFLQDGDWVLEFAAHIGDRNLKGVDIFHFNADGLITDLEVMIRPANAIEALSLAMFERVSAAGKLDLIKESGADAA